MSGEQKPSAGAAKDDGKGKDGATQLDAATLASLKELPNLLKTVSTLSGGMAALNKQIESLRPKQDDGKGGDKGKGKGKKAAPADDDDEEEDIELWDNKKLLRKMKELVETAVKPVKEEGDAAAVEQFKREFMAKIEKERAKHKDFDDWKDEMGVLIKRSPDLEPSELYTLVRAANAKKAKELDAKYEKKEEEEQENEEQEEGKGKKKKLAFGGLTPTSGRSTPGGKKLSRAEAAEDAWRQTMSAFNIQ